MLRHLLRYGVLLLLLMGLAQPRAQASHLLGGEMTYSYLGALGPAGTPFRYRVTVLIYVNAGPSSSVPDGRPTIAVNFYNKSQNGQLIRSVNLPRLSNPLIVPPGCTQAGTPVQVRLCRYEALVDLPVSFDGYYATYTDGTRNLGITNLRTPSDTQQQTIYMEMAPPLLPNASPTFSDTAVVVVCQGDTSLILNNAVDPNGDRLVYSLVTPYDRLNNTNLFTPPPLPVIYGTGFSALAPFGTAPGNLASLNASTGLARYATTQLGNFVVSVEVKEFRTINGQEVLIGSTRREIQLVVRTCPANNSPQLTSGTTLPRTFTVQEGQPLSFTVGATDADNNPITLRANSVLLDGPAGFNTTFAGQVGTVLPGAPTGSATVGGSNGTVSGTFNFTPRCGDARATPYDVVITATDAVNCNSKTVADVFQIFVTRAPAPATLLGDSVICDAAQPRTYTATGPVPAGGYAWRVYGGTIMGPATGSSVQVQWTGTGQGRVTVRNRSAFGCLSDSVSRGINLRPASTLAVTVSSPVICAGQSTTLTATGGTTYTWTGGNQTFTGPSITVAPTQTTTYAVTSGDGVCTTTRQLTVTVNLAAQAQAGPDRTTCSDAATPIGAPALAGYTYQWSPAVGLSSATAAQPTVTLTNTGAAPIQQRYILLATTAQGCVARDTVFVTVNPAVVANAGPGRTECSGTPLTLGTPALPGYTYSWSPAAGLSSATAAQPALTLTNTGAAPLTLTYTLTATSPQGCTASSPVTVTLNPAATANAGPDAAVCSGVPLPLGTAALAGYTYQWSPATGLSSATAAQPTVTLSNTGAAPIQQRYILLATTAQGCVARDTVFVTVNPAVVANAGAATVSLCPGEQLTLGVAPVPGYSYLWSVPAGTGLSISNPTAAQPVVTNVNAGTATLTGTFSLTVTSAQGCTATATVNYNTYGVVVLNAGPDRVVCSGEASIIGQAPANPAQTAGYTYQWSPATGLSSSTVLQPTLTLSNTTAAPQQYTYIVLATAPTGCARRDTVRVTINPAADARAGADAAICPNGSTSIGAAALTGYTYSWAPATGLSSATAAQPTVTLPNASTTTALTQQYILTVTNSFGCVDRDTVVVTVNPTVVAAAGPARTVCSGATVALGTAALPGYTYSWAPATGLSSATAAQPTFSQTLAAGAAPLTLTYTLTATSPQGCTATSSVTVTLNPAAAVNAGADVAVCADKSVRLGTAALAGYTYQWSPATGLSSATAAQPTFSQTLAPNAPAQTLTYTVTATTPQGCSATDQVIVTLNPRPALDSIQGSASVCPTVQGIAYSIRNPRASAYQWIVSGGTIAGGQGTPAITVNWGAASSTASVKAFTLSQAGCSSDTVVFPVRINQVLLTARPAGPARVCQADGPYTYQTQLTAGSTYGWQIIGGTQVSTNQASVVVNWTRPGIGKIVVTESSNPAGGRCLGTSDTLYVTVLPSPAAQQIAGPARYCSNTPGVYSVPNVAGSTYRWTLTGGTSPTATGNTVTLNGLAAGTYTLSVTETNASACAGPVATRTFTVDPLPVAPVVTGPRSICPEGLTGIAYSIGGASGTSTYQWTVTGGSITAGQGTGSVQVNFAANATTRSVVVTETSQFGCAGPATTIILPFDNATVALNTASVDQTSDRKITLALNVADRANNAGQVRILRRNAGAGAYTQVGTVANAAGSYDDTSVDADANAYDYRLELLNSCGTVLNSTSHTTMRLEVAGTQPGSGRAQDQVTLRWNAYQGFAVQRYEVYRRADNGSQELVQTVAATAAPTYTVSFVTSAAGFDQRFRVKAVGASLSSFSNEADRAFANELEFYNVMTPNGDQLNDQLFIKNVELYPGNTLAVFNRWGKQVYQTRDYRNTWGGDAQPAGTYYFMFTDGTGKVTKGWFEILR